MIQKIVQILPVWVGGPIFFWGSLLGVSTSVVLMAGVTFQENILVFTLGLVSCLACGISQSIFEKTNNTIKEVEE